MKYALKNTIDYYDRASNNYDEKTYGTSRPGYSPNFYRLEIVKLILSKLSAGTKILDAGCGTGEFLVHLAESGYEPTGCDVSSGMLTKARQKISEVSKKKAHLVETPLDDLRMFQSNSFDHIFCLGVLPYIPEENEAQCYSELHRVIKPNGYLVTAHQNEVFDMFTFNKYTLRFFERNIYPLIREISDKRDLGELKAQISSLITNPDKPTNVDPQKSARDTIFVKPENPITYPNKLRQYHFENRDFYYYHFHALPPILRNPDADLLELSEKMEIHFSQRWQGMFMSSTFINVAQAI